MIIMLEKRLALMVFYDDKNRVLLQDRSNMSKWGEEYGYFGGSIDGNESPSDTVIREIQEELEFKIHKPKYLGKYESIGKPLKDPSIEIKVIQEVFFIKITEKDYQKMVLHEGVDKKWFSISDAKKLNMYPLNSKILDDLKKNI